MNIPDGFSAPGAMRSPYTIRQVVAWGEMDVLGHVNNAVYLRWIESVRSHYFEMVGINALFAAERIGPILARVELNFLSTIDFPDELWLSTEVVRLGNSSFTMRNRIWSPKRDKICASGEAVIVMIDYGCGDKAVRVPEPIRAAMRAIEGAAMIEESRIGGA